MTLLGILSADCWWVFLLVEVYNIKQEEIVQEDFYFFSPDYEDHKTFSHRPDIFLFLEEKSLKEISRDEKNGSFILFKKCN